MKQRATISATDLRVRLGEMLRRLEDEDLIIEKGGIPVALITRFTPGDRWIQESEGARQSAREADLNTASVLANIAAIRERVAATPPASTGASAADEDVWNAIREDFRTAPPSGMDADALIADVYRARAEGSRLNRYYILTEDGVITEVGDERRYEPADRQRHLYRRDIEPRLVADRGDEEYEA